VGIIVIASLVASFPAMALSGKGRDLYQKYCTQCHETEQGDWRSPESRKFVSYVMRTTERNLKQRVSDGGKLCPGYLVIFSEEEVENVVDYIKVLR